MNPSTMAFAVLAGIFLALATLGLFFFISRRDQPVEPGTSIPLFGLVLLGLVLATVCFVAFWISFLAGQSPVPI